MRTYESFMDESYGAATDAGKFKTKQRPYVNTLKNAPAFNYDRIKDTHYPVRRFSAPGREGYRKRI